MNVVIVGGGPAGLYFAILMKKLDARHTITILERDGPHDTFGWGIVFSDQTFSYLEASDRESFAEIVQSCQTWDNVDVVHRGRKVSVHGNSFSGVARLRFLNILQQRATDLGVTIRFKTNVTDIAALARDADLLVGADGANSLVRHTWRERFEPSLDVRTNKYIWLGTNRLFHGLTLTFRESVHGVFAAHSYKFNPGASTFIVECTSDTWAQAGFERMSEAETCAYLERVFVDDLEGQPLLTNNFVRWLNFVLVKNRVWRYDNVVLLGDALHTAHFSIGSGTKLALEDSIALFTCLEASPASRSAALDEFQRVRKPIVDRYQEAAFESLRWFEHMQDDMHLEPLAFAYRLMTRSGRIDIEKLRKRDPGFVAEYEKSVL